MDVFLDFRSLASSPDEATVAVDGESFGASRAILTQCVLLAVALAVGQWLEKRKVAWLGEASVALIIGILMGLLSRVFTFSATYVSWMSFQTEFFFLALLPPIMFEAGFSLQVKPFFRNIGAIVALAFIGTVVSTGIVGFIMWAAGKAGFSLSLTFIQALVYGSLISTTDTVTIVAVLQRLGANEDLYALVFGESCLNDAVGVVLYRTLTLFLHERVTVGSTFAGILSFMGVFLGSMLIGVGVAFVASLSFKTKFFRHHHMPLESCMVVIFAFSCYMMADSFGLSGIVAILFCGLVSSHYVRPNISRNARDRTAAFFKVLSMLAEIFVFIYIGTSISIETDAWRHWRTWSVLVVALLALAVSRAANIWPLAGMVNYVRPPELRIPQSQQIMMWFSGMRGAMAFAMALRALEVFPHDVGHALLVCTFFVVLLTVLFNGGASPWMMRVLALRAEDEDSNRAKAALHALGTLGHGQHHEDSRHVHINLEGQDDGFEVEPSERSASSVQSAGSGASTLSGSGYGTEPDSAPASRASSFSRLRPGKMVSKMRELNRSGVLTKLEALDTKYLQKIFVGGPRNRDIELSEMSSQGDDDSPHDAAAQRSGAFTIAAHDGNGWPTTSALRSASSPAPEADVAIDRGGGSLLRPVMRTLPSAAVAGGRGHYADRSSAQPDQPEELLQDHEVEVAASAEQEVALDAASTESSTSSAPEGSRASSDEDASTSAATVDAVEIEEAAPRAWLPAPEQVISNNRDANNSEFVRKIKEVWPARCQADNERYIRSLKAKLEAALQKVKDLETDKSNLARALDHEIAAKVLMQKDIDMLRNVLRDRTNSPEKQPSAASSAVRAPTSERTDTRPGGQTVFDAEKKPPPSARCAIQRNSGQENLPQRSAGSKNSTSWRPPRPSTTAVPATPVIAAPKVSKPVKRRAWSWADEADLSPEEQARLLDEYLRANPDPFAKK